MIWWLIITISWEGGLSLQIVYVKAFLLYGATEESPSRFVACVAMWKPPYLSVSLCEEAPCLCGKKHFFLSRASNVAMSCFTVLQLFERTMSTARFTLFQVLVCEHLPLNHISSGKNEWEEVLLALPLLNMREEAFFDLTCYVRAFVTLTYLKYVNKREETLLALHCLNDIEHFLRYHSRSENSKWEEAFLALPYLNMWEEAFFYLHWIIGAMPTKQRKNEFGKYACNFSFCFVNELDEKLKTMH